MSWPTRIATVLALVLAVLAAGWRVHVKADAAGYARAISEQTVVALAATEKRRLDERALSIKNQEVTNEYIAEKSRRAAADADIAGRLREYEAALNRPAPGPAPANPPACSGADEPYRAIASECAAALVRLDGYAQTLAGKAAALQGYAGQVCMK